MERQYYVCVDFGHGETTASCIDLTATYQLNKDGFYDVPKLNILNGSTDEARKVETVICRGESGQWKFATDLEDFALPDLSMGFKNKVEKMLLEDKEHYKAFINLVFRAIIDRNNHLHFDDTKPEARNFELCIACPSAWGEDDAKGHNSVIEEYKSFFNEALPMPVKFVIRESDAAFFKFIHLTNGMANLKLLVIDLGSSTIDFTYYPHEDSENYVKGAQNGASRVEQAIQDWCSETQEGYKDAKSKIPLLLEKTGAGHLNWGIALRHFIKIQKEDFYTHSRSKMMLNFPVSFALGDELTEKLMAMGHCGDILHHCNINTTSLDTILANYRSNLKDDLTRLHDSGAAPEMILLTGGASRMPWVKVLVEDVFQGANVYRDNNPSYVVSDGIAMYAYADHMFRQKLNGMVSSIKSELPDEELVRIITEAFNDAMREIQLPPVLDICDDFVNGKFTTLQELLNKVGEHNDKIVGANASRIKMQISNKVYSKLSNTISNKMNAIFKECFHTTRSIPFNLDWSGVDFSSVGIDNDADIEAIHEIGNALFCQGIFGGSLNYTRERTLDERKQFDEHFREFQNTALFGLPEKIKSSALSACNSSINGAISAVKSKGLFSIY